MTDISRSANGTECTIPADLIDRMMLTRGTLTNYVLVRGAVQRFNAATGSTLDPIDVAEALVREGYSITGIAKRKTAITPTPDGLILNKAQLLQILEDDRVEEFPKLELAVEKVRMLLGTGMTMQDAAERIGTGVKMNSFSRSYESLDSRQALEKFMLDQIMWFELKYSSVFAHLKDAGRDEQEDEAKRVVRQAMFLFDNLDSPEQLVTKTALRRRAAYIESQREEERQAKVRKREELLASREAAERWLFGVARGACRDSKGNIEYAGQELIKSKRARELIDHHRIDLFDFAQRQIDALGDERTVRREIGRIEGPLAVLLTAFAKPRSIDGSVQAVRKDPADYLLRAVSLWFDAMFVGELPAGAYADVTRNEETYQERYRERSSEVMRRDSWSFGRGENDEFDSFFDDLDRRDAERNAVAMRLYETSRVAMLWWKCPSWLRQRILKPYIRTELHDVSTMSRGFTVKDFLAHIDKLIADENRTIHRQNTLLGTVDTDDLAALERFWKELIAAKGLTDEVMRAGIEGRAYANDLDEPTRQHAEAAIKSSQARLKELTEMREFVDVEFVMTRTERDAVIELRKRERDRWSLRAFRF